MPSSPGSEPEERATTEEQPSAPAEEQGNGGARVAQLQERIDQLDDRYKRSLADLDNYRKRSARDVDRRVAEQTERLTRDWLEALDSVERALRTSPAPDDNPMAEGLRAVLNQMESILERQGATRIGEAGERFDPERHEAIGVTENDELPDQTVTEVARSGFALGDRVLRPAQVVVSRRAQRAG